MALNAAQRQAVESDLRPAFVVAGAGSGKTTVLIERIVYFINQGIDSRKILAITFTNKARDEIKSRISSKCNCDVKHVYTFHAFFHEVLKKDIRLVDSGRDTQFRIIDDSDKGTIVRRILKDLGFDKEYSLKSRFVAEKIGKFKFQNACSKYSNYASKKLEFIKKLGEDVPPHVFTRILDEYEDRLKACNSVDFEDLEILVDRLMDLDRVRDYWRSSFKAILIDEFQDTDVLQLEIVKRMVSVNGNIFCVGDPDQSIYGFRGAKPGVCLEFLRLFRIEKPFKLEENYRSTKNILAVANHLINRRTTELSKNLFTNNPDGDKVVYREFSSDREEAFWVVSEIQRLVREGMAKYSDIAILYRNNRISVPFEAEFNRKRIEYLVTSSADFYSREEVKVITSYLNLIFKDKDLASFERARSFPMRGIGDASFTHFMKFRKDHDLSILEAIDRIDECEKIKGKAKAGFIEMSRIIRDLRMYKDENIVELVKQILDVSGYFLHLKRVGETNRISNIDKFTEILSEDKGKSNEEIVNQISLRGRDLKSKTKDYVLLSTVHQVKGLEFKYVFVVKMVEGIFPSSKAMYSEDSIDEERRLAYVAFTRAKSKLYITKSPAISMDGSITNQNSRFIDEVIKLTD